MMTDLDKEKAEEISATSNEANKEKQASQSTTSMALEAAGDSESAVDIAALDDVAQAVEKKLAATRTGLVERLIYGPAPDEVELQSGSRVSARLQQQDQPLVEAAIACMANGEAFTLDGKISSQLRNAVAKEKAYGLTVPVEFGGKGANYAGLARVIDLLSSQGLGGLAVELSGQLTIGASSVLGYGSDEQKKTYLPMLVEGRLMGFGLTEVGVGVNAKKIQAYVEEDENGDYRLFADGSRNKLWITSATHGGLLGLVARIGKDSREIGLFVLQLPEKDILMSDDCDYEFRCEHSGVAAFEANINSRVHFMNFPVPKQNQIPSDGVEVLFYCLRMGRCMLAATSAGYQRMLARDASHFAIQRIGVGGPVIRHEIPRLALARMLGGSLQSRALSYLSLKQDEDGVDLAGLRDLTKSAAANTGQESMIACEHVLGGRSFAKGSRVSDARVNLHLFGVVEGEDDMIRMGMVRDVTLKFVNEYLSGMMDAINAANVDEHGQMLPADERILRIGVDSIIQQPQRSFKALSTLFKSRQLYQLIGWVVKNIVDDLLRLPGNLLPVSWIGRYRGLPKELRSYARFAESRLRRIRWSYLGFSLFYQLELTRAQIPLQRLGYAIEQLVSMLVICHHAAVQDRSQQQIAAVQAQVLKEKYQGVKLFTSVAEIQRLRRNVSKVGDAIEGGYSSLLNEIEPEPFAHPWAEDKPEG
jgi:alkylation response protein AidB-like acyl-CoA dehydrogenase